MSFFTSNKIIICAGSGGVGKTTISASLALKAAQEGLRVLVMTIDPAKRLSTSLGLDHCEGICKVPGQNFLGTLYAEILDSEKVFDEFLNKNVSNKDLLEKIKNNRLYKQLSTTLSGSQEFTSIVALNEAIQSNDYDLVVLDTPPSEHAMDFLKAPEKIENLFNGKVTRWFIEGQDSKSWLRNMIHKGTRIGLNVLQKVTGSQFMDELSDFFSSLKSIEKSIQESTFQVKKLLFRGDTSFVLVTGFDEAKIKEGFEFLKELKKLKYNLRKIVVNRAYPIWYKESLDQNVENECYKNIVQYYKLRLESYNKLKIKLDHGLGVVNLPEMSQDIHGLEGLLNFASYINLES